MATKKMVKKPVMKKGGSLKKKGDGGSWHPPMVAPGTPQMKSAIEGPMNKPTNTTSDPADALKKAQNQINPEEAFKRQQLNKQKKGGAMKKMKTGGMVNPNANLKATATAGSRGVKSGVNPKAAASKVARGRSGGTSSAPKTATPKAKYGMTMKKYGEGGGTKSGSSMYNIKQGPAKTPTGSTSTMNPVEKAKAKYGMTVKRKK